MAKIYENRVDFERDVLDDQVARLRHKQSLESNAGLSFLGMGLVSDLVRAGLRAGSSVGKVLGFASVVAFITGVVEVLRSWHTGSKAHDAEMAREKLGPAHVALPADLSVPSVEVPEAPCKPCDLKRFGDAAQPKTLMEYATHSPEAGPRKF
jgi:hypothetical protein